MKRLIFVLACAALLWACSDAPILEVPPIETSDVQSRAAVIPDGGVSESNPELILDWENQSAVVLNSGTTVQLPWSNNGVSTQLSTDFCRSISKKDGWTMLFHTFDKVGGEARQNYMLFYNLFTGVLKVFYYYEGFQPSTNAQWIIYARPLNGLTPYKFMDIPDYFAKADDEPCVNRDFILGATNESAIATANNGIPNGLTPGWNGFDFQVSRYADDLTDCDFKIAAYTTNVIKSSFLGSLNLSTTGTITSTTTPVTTSESKYNGLASFAGNKATKVIDKLSAVGNSTNSGITIGKSVLNLVANIASGNIGGIIKSGFNLLFGRTTVTQTTYSTTSDVRLSSEGEMKLSGLSSWQTTSDVPVISFNLKEILAAQNRPIVVIKPPYVVPQSIGIGDGVPIGGTVKDELKNLGVWTLKTRPKAYWNTTQKVDVTTFQDEGSSIYICGTAPYPTLSKTELDVEINPYLKSYVQSHSVSVKYIGYVSKDPSGYISKTPVDSIKEPISAIYGGSSVPVLRDLFYSDPYKILSNLPIGKTQVSDVVGLSSKDYDTSSMPGSTAFYVKWELPSKYKIIAMVTVTMQIKYMDNEFSVSESRIYHVNNVEERTDIRNNWPQVVVMRQ